MTSDLSFHSRITIESKMSHSIRPVQTNNSHRSLRSRSDRYLVQSLSSTRKVQGRKKIIIIVRWLRSYVRKQTSW